MSARYLAVVSLPSVGVSLPAGCRMPAETEPHRRTLMAWPPDVPQCIFTPDQLEPAREAYAEIVRAIAGFEPVTLVTRPDDVANALAHVGDAAEIVALEIDDSWMRDDGPIVVRDPGGELHAVHFGFNAWGDKQQPYAADALVGAGVARHLGLPVHEAPMVLEGGSIAVDGWGALVTTERCLLHPNRNPELSRAEIESGLRSWLGVDRIVWLADGIAEDSFTDGHVDNVVAFTSTGAILVQGCDDRTNPNAVIAADNAQRLRDAGFDVVEVPVLPYADFAGEHLPVPYVNLYAGNGFVSVPVSGHAFDDEACRIIGAQFPGRVVVRAPGVVLAYGGGGVHCITQQIPA
jgi:agmatine deiminase